MFDNFRLALAYGKEQVKELKTRKEAGSMKMADIITAVIGIVIAVALVPVVLNNVASAVNSTTNTTYQTLLNVIPIVFIAGILIIVLYWMLKG